MSIQSEINRINTAKTNISNTLKANGVTVPTGTKIEGYSTLIENAFNNYDSLIDTINGEVV